MSLALSLTPISELRGAVPYALAQGVHPLVAYLVCVAANALVGPLVYVFLGSVHRLLSHLAPYRRLFAALVARARTRVQQKVERYGYVGLALFVAIPLPVTGAYTGALGAWVLGMRPRGVFLAVGCGVVVAGVVVTLVSYLGITALGIFTG